MKIIMIKLRIHNKKNKKKNYFKKTKTKRKLKSATGAEADEQTNLFDWFRRG